MVLINLQIIISNFAIIAPVAAGQSSLRYKTLCQIVSAQRLAAAKFPDVFEIIYFCDNNDYVKFEMIVVMSNQILSQILSGKALPTSLSAILF